MENRSFNNFWNGNEQPPQQSMYSQMPTRRAFNAGQWQGNTNVPYASVPRAMQLPSPQGPPQIPQMPQYDNVVAPLECPRDCFRHDEQVLDNGEAFACYTGMDMSMNGAMGQNGRSGAF